MAYCCKSCQLIFTKQYALQQHQCPECSTPLSLIFKSEQELQLAGYTLFDCGPSPNASVTTPSEPHGTLPTPFVGNTTPSGTRTRADRVRWMDQPQPDPQPIPVTPPPPPQPQPATPTVPQEPPRRAAEVPAPPQPAHPPVTPGNAPVQSGNSSQRVHGGPSGPGRRQRNPIDINWPTLIRVLLVLFLVGAGCTFIYSIWVNRQLIANAVALVIGLLLVIMIISFAFRRPRW